MRDIEDLKQNALLFWTEELSELEKESSIIPKLLETQDKFISILKIADANPFAWKDALETSTMSPNLFLKHLSVLSDVGGESLKRYKTNLPGMFPENEMIFSWKGAEYSYIFKTIKERVQWSNTSLKIDGEGLSVKIDLEDFPQVYDVIALILYAGNVLNADLPTDIIDKCIIGNLIGHTNEIETFVRQRYIWVSRITGGAKANSLGYLAQNYVADYVMDKLPQGWERKKKIPNISHNDNRTDMSFDLVVCSPSGKYCAIESSFQVTTNSTIERKGGQAQDRQKQLHNSGHYIAYVIDGAGNFERVSAITSISQFSDCIVTFKDSELDKLIDFLISID